MNSETSSSQTSDLCETSLMWTFYMLKENSAMILRQALFSIAKSGRSLWTGPDFLLLLLFVDASVALGFQLFTCEWSLVVLIIVILLIRIIFDSAGQLDLELVRSRTAR